MGGDKLIPRVFGFEEESDQGRALGERKGEIFRGELLPGLEPTKGARALLERLRAEGHRLVTATSAGDDDLDLLLERAGVADLIITDPPRAGMHEDVVRRLLALRCPRIVYISCNPATQARDLELLDPAYQVTRVQPVDMFPHTHHVENVVLLELR